jgi:DNA-directed RNA polymerase subunit RPC12/RpoP
MERIMELKEAIRDGTVAEHENELVMRFLPRDEQFYTDSCTRCAGLLVNEWCYDFCNEGEQKTKVLRCVQCGYRIDPVILQNQRRPTINKVHTGDTWHMYQLVKHPLTDLGVKKFLADWNAQLDKELIAAMRS